MGEFIPPPSAVQLPPSPPRFPTPTSLEPFPPSPSPSTLPYEPSPSSSPTPSLRSPSPSPIPVIILDSDPPSPSNGDPSASSEFGETLEDFARDLPELEDSSDPEFPIDPSEHPSYNGTPESGYHNSLNYFLNQFPFLDLPIPEGAFCVGPGPVDHQELFNHITTTPSNSVIPWYLPGYQLSLGVPIQAFWKRFPPSTVRFEDS